MVILTPVQDLRQDLRLSFGCWGDLKARAGALRRGGLCAPSSELRPGRRGLGSARAPGQLPAASPAAFSLSAGKIPTGSVQPGEHGRPPQRLRGLGRRWRRGLGRFRWPLPCWAGQLCSDFSMLEYSVFKNPFQFLHTTLSTFLWWTASFKSGGAEWRLTPCLWNTLRCSRSRNRSVMEVGKDL